MPLAAVCLPAWDIGWPYLARFCGVSGTGPFVVVVVVIDAPVAGSAVVTEVEMAVPVAAAAGAATYVEVVAAAGEVVAVVLDCAEAAPPMRAVAATAAIRLMIFMAGLRLPSLPTKSPASTMVHFFFFAGVLVVGVGSGAAAGAASGGGSGRVAGTEPAIIRASTTWMIPFEVITSAWIMVALSAFKTPGVIPSRTI